jgi:protein-tyrosine phosphatase
LIPILAHPERNLDVVEHPERLLELVEKGALVQMNAGSITGKYGDRIKGAAEMLLMNGIVHFVASDAHSTRNRPIKLSPAVERMKELIGDEAVRLVEDNPSEMLQGKTIEAVVPRRLEWPRKKGFPWFSVGRAQRFFRA